MAFSPHSLALFPAPAGSKLRTSGSICPQYSWHSKLGGGPTGEAVIDRIVHNSYTITIDGETSMRERLGLSNNFQALTIKKCNPMDYTNVSRNQFKLKWLWDIFLSGTLKWQKVVHSLANSGKKVGINGTNAWQQSTTGSPQVLWQDFTNKSAPALEAA